MPEKQGWGKGGKGIAITERQNVKACNIHPTSKPIKLMSWLITIGSRGGDTVLDPFCGSGTTLCAARMLDRNYIGIEKELEYVKIATKRIEAWGSETPLFYPQP